MERVRQEPRGNIPVGSDQRLPRSSSHPGHDGQEFSRTPVQDPGVPRTRARRTTIGRTPESRYERGHRRTKGEPLSASWEPDTELPPPPPEDDEDGDEGDDKEPGRVGRLITKYGWRAYAVPVLMVLSVLVVFDTAKGADESTTQNAEDGNGSGSDAPIATERPATPAQLNIPTAELPQEGGEFTQAGAGSWHIVPGDGPKVGTGGKTYTYAVEVEDGLDPAGYVGDGSFADSVEGILSDPRSWTGGGAASVQRTSDAEQADFVVSLTSPDTAHRPDQCGFSIQYEASCYDRPDKRVVINLARWVRGAAAYAGDMTGYRQYAINHEVGHALNNKHRGCDADGALAPVMMQQTFGVSNDYVAQLNEADGPNSGAVPSDGKVCKPNAWPNP